MKKKFLLALVAFFWLFYPGSGQARENPFGVLTFLPWNHSWNNYMYPDYESLDKAIKLIDKLGVSIIRLDFPWNLIEEEEGVFDFKRLDYITRKCRQKNIKILGVLGYSAPWTGADWNNPPPDKKAFLNYLEVTVSRYKDYVDYWELWNEPDSFFYWQPQDEMKTYTKLLKAAYPLIKSIDPQSSILIGGLTSSGFYALRNVLKRGGGDYFDIVNFHFFVDPIRKNSIESVGWKLYHIQNELKKRGLDKKIWITEIGAPGTKARKECLWWYGKCPGEKEQAAFLERAYNFLLKQKNVEKIFWAFFQDTDHFKSGVDYFGLIRADYSQKPAYRRYQKIIQKWQTQR